MAAALCKKFHCGETEEEKPSFSFGSVVLTVATPVLDDVCFGKWSTEGEWREQFMLGLMVGLWKEKEPKSRAEEEEEEEEEE